MEINEKNVIMYLRKSRADDSAQQVCEVLAKHELQLQDYAVREFGKKISEEHICREVVSGETIDDRPVMKKVLHMLTDICWCSCYRTAKIVKRRFA